MTIDELRADFESMANRKFFDISRRENGEYKSVTYFLWCGYWECAVKNGLIVGEDANFKKMKAFN